MLNARGALVSIPWSNGRHVRGKVRCALDREAGFELSVPHDTTKVSRPPRVASSLISGNEK